jgi:hypothetical protein
LLLGSKILVQENASKHSRNSDKIRETCLPSNGFNSVNIVSGVEDVLDDDGGNEVGAVVDNIVAEPTTTSSDQLPPILLLVKSVREAHFCGIQNKNKSIKMMHAC